MNLVKRRSFVWYVCPQAPATACYISEFITRGEEQALLGHVYGAPRPKWTQLSRRRLQNWGGVPHARGMLAEPLPAWLAALPLRLPPSLPPPPPRNHILINEYLPGQGIMPHHDGDLFFPNIATISLGSHTVLRFSEPTGDGPGPGSVLLEPRSLLVLTDRLYDHYKHGIEERTRDVLDETILNLDMCLDVYSKGLTVDRGTRVSLTIRHVPKTTSFKLNFGN